jgi:hypothetical protein
MYDIIGILPPPVNEEILVREALTGMHKKIFYQLITGIVEKSIKIGFINFPLCQSNSNLNRISCAKVIHKLLTFAKPKLIITFNDEAYSMFYSQYATKIIKLTNLDYHKKYGASSPLLNHDIALLKRSWRRVCGNN